MTAVVSPTTKITTTMITNYSYLQLHLPHFLFNINNSHNIIKSSEGHSINNNGII